MTPLRGRKPPRERPSSGSLALATLSRDAGEGQQAGQLLESQHQEVAMSVVQGIRRKNAADPGGFVKREITEALANLARYIWVVGHPCGRHR